MYSPSARTHFGSQNPGDLALNVPVVNSVDRRLDLGGAVLVQDQCGVQINMDPEANHYLTKDVLARGGTGSEISDYGLNGTIAKASILTAPNDQSLSTQKCFVDFYSKTDKCTNFFDYG